MKNNYKVFFPSTIMQFFVLILISSILGAPILLLKDSMSLPQFGTLAYLCFNLIFIGGVLLKNRWSNLNFNFRLDYNNTFLYVVFVVVVFQLGIHIPISRLISLYFFPKDVGVSSVYILLTGVVMAPLFEEIMFRGVLLRGLLNRSKPEKAIIVSSLIFAIVHLSLSQFIVGFILGLLLGYEYYRTNNLGNTIVLHSIANILMFSINFLLYLFPLKANSITCIILLFIICFSLLILWILLKKYLYSK